jgi:hypothetical protein
VIPSKLAPCGAGLPGCPSGVRDSSTVATRVFLSYVRQSHLAFLCADTLTLQFASDEAFGASGFTALIEVAVRLRPPRAFFCVRFPNPLHEATLRVSEVCVWVACQVVCRPGTWSPSGLPEGDEYESMECAPCTPSPGKGCWRPGSTAAAGQTCPAGRFSADATCAFCPAGRYGSTSGLRTSDCTGACEATPGNVCSLPGATSAGGMPRTFYLSDRCVSLCPGGGRRCAPPTALAPCLHVGLCVHLY